MVSKLKEGEREKDRESKIHKKKGKNWDQV